MLGACYLAFLNKFKDQRKQHDYLNEMKLGIKGTLIKLKNRANQ